MAEIFIDLENILKRKKISKNKLCMNCGLQRTQLNNYCKNKVARIDLKILARLCEYLDCTPNDILKLSHSEANGGEEILTSEFSDPADSDTEVQELENYLQCLSEQELSETVDLFLKNEFNEIDPGFRAYYNKELDRLRMFDALHEQVKILKKYKKELEKYSRKEEAYQIKMKNLDKLYDMFLEWQNGLRESNDSYIETFYLDNIDKLLASFPEIEDLCINVVKKMIRTAREEKGISNIKDKYKITEPEKPKQNIEFQKDQVDRSYSEKTEADLLNMLGRNTLSYLVFVIDDALKNRSTEKLKLAIRFVFAHYTDSNTKGKESSRKAQQETNSLGKTSGTTMVNLLKEYNSMIPD